MTNNTQENTGKAIKVKKPFYKKWWVWLIAVIIIGSMANSSDEPEVVAEPVAPVEVQEEVAVEPEVAPEPEVEEEKVEPVAEVKPEPKPEPKKPELSLSQKNAIKKAESYLSFSAFSKSGLVEQLVFEGFPKEEAQFAVDNITVDWNEQAGKKAESYLSFSSFSRSGLIEQLEFEGFTSEQAVHGANHVGL